MLKIKEIKVENPKKIDDTDLADLCNITEQAINAGGGFGWIKVPPREILIKYIEIIKRNILLREKISL